MASAEANIGLGAKGDTAGGGRGAGAVAASA